MAVDHQAVDHQYAMMAAFESENHQSAVMAAWDRLKFIRMLCLYSGRLMLLGWISWLEEYAVSMLLWVHE